MGKGQGKGEERKREQGEEIWSAGTCHRFVHQLASDMKAVTSPRTPNFFPLSSKMGLSCFESEIE